MIIETLIALAIPARVVTSARRSSDGSPAVVARLSTGDQDRTRPVTSIRALADELTRRRGFPAVDVRVFRGGHALGQEELDALVAWWLRR